MNCVWFKKEQIASAATLNLGWYDQITWNGLKAVLQNSGITVIFGLFCYSGQFTVHYSGWFKSLDKFLHIWDWNKRPTTVHTKIWSIFKHGTTITVSDSELQLLRILMGNYFFRHQQGPLPSNQEPTQLPWQESEKTVKQLIPRQTLSRTSQCDLPRLSDFHCGLFLFEVSISD